MGTETWSSWASWNGTVEQTLVDAQHKQAGDETVDDVREAAGEDGTGSVLDVYKLGKKKSASMCWVLSPAELLKHFGSKTPHKKAIDGGLAKFLDSLERGETVAVTAYLRGQPSAVCFAGWSVD